MMVRRLLRWFVPMILIGFPLAAAENTLLRDLLRDGVPVSPKAAIALTPPTLADGLPAAEQRRALEKVIGGKYAWEEFTRKSVVAPFVLKITDADPNDAAAGRRVDLWFVAYGALEKIQSDDFLTARLQTVGAADDDNASRARLLSAAELAERDLAPPVSSEDPRYLAAEMTLFEKVRISAVTRNLKTATDDSVVVASVLDSKFDRDKTLPNGWRTISRDDTGRKTLGTPQPYHGLASYVKATRSAELPGALFVEYHIAFVEPAGWFQGANLLRSKLPLAAQDGVRKFRRSLDEK